MGCKTSTPVNNTGNANNVVIPTGNVAGGPAAARPIGIRPSPFSNGSPITLGELTNRRNEYWDTRVDGNTQMWQTLRRVADATLADDHALASALLSASNIYTPYGTLEICYDELGHEYKIPIFVYTNPIDLIVQTPQPSADGISKSDITSAVLLKLPPRKNPNAPVVELKLKLRINPGDINFNITIANCKCIYELKKLIYEYSQNKENAVPLLLPDDRQRIIFLGRELKDTQYIDEVGLDDVRVVQLFLRPLPNSTKQTPQGMSASSSNSTIGGTASPSRAVASY